MLSLVNYGASDSEDNISDEDEVIIPLKRQENGKKSDENSENEHLELSSILPQPINQLKINETIEEDDDEFLHKKEVPEVAPPPKVKQKVKITIPKLSDFKDDEDDNADSVAKYPTASNKKAGLLSMLPKPAHSSASMNKTSVSVPLKPPQVISKNTLKETEVLPSTSSSASSSNSQATKKIGLIPYALMDHSKKPADDNKKSTSKRKPQESDESDEEASSSFFSFDTKIEDLPKVNDDEIKAMVEKERNRIEERRRKAEQSEEIQYEEPDYSQYYQQQHQQQQEQIDQEAMRALIGGTKAKRSKLDDIQIVDISDREVLPDKDEWLRKNLAGETSFLPTGKIDEKGPALAKRKHQISYLSMRAEKNMAELEAMWAANRQSNREGRSKYGF